MIGRECGSVWPSLNLYYFIPGTPTAIVISPAALITVIIATPITVIVCQKKSTTADQSLAPGLASLGLY